jgi:hypothetical protein
MSRGEEEEGGGGGEEERVLYPTGMLQICIYTYSQKPKAMMRWKST